MPIAPRGARKAMRGKCERGRGKCERGHGSANANGAGAEAFAGDGYSQKASFGPMAAISRRGQGGRIYNNTRARVLLRQMCVKPADLTTHSPPKTFARPRTATRPPRALPLPHAAPTHAGRLRDAFPADLTTHSPPKASSRPRTATRPSRVLPLPHAAPTPARRLRDAFPAEALRSPPQRHALPEHFRSPTQSRRAPADCAMHSPPPSQHIPRRRPSLTPAQRHALPLPSCHIPAAQTPARRPHNPFPAEDLRPTRSAALPPPPFRFGHKKTAPHSGCAMPNVSVDRRCGRSLGLVSRALFAAVAGRWRGA